MKKLIASCGMAVLAGLSTLSWAGKADQLIVQEAANNIVTVSQVAKLADETGITLTGQISRHLQGDHYELKDRSGSIGIEIDDDLWRQANLKVGDRVRLIGEVDTHRYKPTDIEVVKIEKLAR